jgi:hypothetical protein
MLSIDLLNHGQVAIPRTTFNSPKKEVISMGIIARIKDFFENTHEGASDYDNCGNAKY